MKTKKSLKMAARMVVHSRLRSWLTIIGIVIGVASVITIVSISDGMSIRMQEQFNSFGSDIITITAGYSRGNSAFGSPGGGRMVFGGSPGGGDTASNSADTPVLNRLDVLALRLVSEIQYISPLISGRAEVYYGGKSGEISITGVDPQIWKYMTTDGLDSGRMLDAADSNVVVIGNRLATQYFDKEIGINKMITIEGSAFRVVGVLEAGTGNSIYMPISTAYYILDKTANEYDSIEVKLKEEIDTTEEIEAVITKIETKMKIERHVTDKTKDFSVSSPTQMIERVTDMSSTLTTFLTGIAAISLLVGAVGVANTMFTSVLEKRKDIGIMKAIGARNKDIMMIFLLNAGLLGLTGGFIGVLIGYAISVVITLVLSTPTVISPQMVAIALLISMITGIVAGLIPAYNGSKLNPVDALRNE